MTVFADSLQVLERNGGDDGTRTRDLCRDSEQVMSIFKDLEEHGRHRKSSQVHLRQTYCVPRCVPRFSAPAFQWIVSE